MVSRLTNALLVLMMSTTGCSKGKPDAAPVQKPIFHTKATDSQAKSASKAATTGETIQNLFEASH